ncbi:hypothetical protein BCEP27_40489 [Burkholderia cepacia]
MKRVSVVIKGLLRLSAHAGGACGKASHYSQPISVQ